MSLFEALGLVPDYGEAIEAAQQDPLNVRSLFGGLTYQDGRVTTQLAPELQQQVTGIYERLGQIDPSQQLGLLRQQAAPYEQQQRLDLENRLFSQGLMGASVVDRPGGARRSLFEAQAGSDLQRQLLAEQMAQQQRASLFGELQNIYGMEQGLFGAAYGYPQNNQVSNLLAQQAGFGPGLMGNLLGGAMMGWGMGGFGLGGGSLAGGAAVGGLV